MTGPGAGGFPVEEPYTGPPPTRRPEPGRWPGGPWPVPPGPPWQPAPWGQVPGGPGPWPPAPWGQAPWQPPQPPASVRWAPPPGTPPHDVPQPFLLAMRTRDWAWWRPLLGLLLLLFVYVVAATVVILVSVITGVAPNLALLDLVDPAVLLITNLTLIVAIPIVWLAWGVAHGMRTGWSASVLARLRWRLLPRLVLLALATLGFGIGLSVLLGVLLGDGVTGPVPDLGWLLLVVVLTTPLQSAAEEYLFRGYLSQAIAGWIGRPLAGAVVAGVLTAALFSLAHVPPDVPTFLSRFFVGLAASAVVWLTGGLEAAIALHAVNNVLVFLLAGALGDAVATEDVPQGLNPVVVVVDALAMGAYVALVARWSRRVRPETVTAAQDLRWPPGALPAGTP